MHWDFQCTVAMKDAVRCSHAVPCNGHCHSMNALALPDAVQALEETFAVAADPGAELFDSSFRRRRRNEKLLPLLSANKSGLGAADKLGAIQE